MNTREQQIHGLAFLGTDYIPENVEITISGGMIADIVPCREPVTSAILPAFFNAHTHIGDTVALDTPVDRPLAELVAPPNGIKHQILKSTPDGDLAAGMKTSVAWMKRTGTLGFADFREGGIHGVSLLASQTDTETTAVILGRDGGELHPAAAGWGLSSARGTEEEIEHAAAVRRAGKLVAVHAGETGTRDIAPAFAMNADLIIHATQFTPADIRQAADSGTAVAVCPRSNWILHASESRNRPPVNEMLDAGLSLMLGTDNAMFVSSDMFAECAFLMQVYGVSAENTLKMATAGFALAGKSSEIAVGSPAHLTVLDDRFELLKWSRHPLATALTRLGSSAVREMISGIHHHEY